MSDDGVIRLEQQSQVEIAHLRTWSLMDTQWLQTDRDAYPILWNFIYKYICRERERNRETLDISLTELCQRSGQIESNEMRLLPDILFFSRPFNTLA